MSEASNGVVRSIWKSGMIIFVGIILEMAISFVAKLLVARDLAQASYGEVAIGLTLLTAFAIVARLGLDTGVARNAAQYEGSERRGVLVSAFSLGTISSILIGTGLFLLAGPLSVILGNPQLAPVLRIVAVGIPAPPLRDIAIGAIRAEGRTLPKVLVKNITGPVARILLVTIVVILGATPTQVILAYVAAHWIGTSLALALALWYTPLIRAPDPWRTKNWEMLAFSVPLMISGGMAFVIGNVDNIMIQFFLGSANVGIYDIAYTLGQTLTISLGAFGFLFLPQISILQTEKRWDEIQRLYHLVTKWSVFLILPPYLVFVFYHTTVIRYTFGEKYAEGGLILIIIATTYFLRTTLGPNHGTLSADGLTNYIMLTNVGMALCNVILNAILIPFFGVLGAAFASLFTFVGLNILYSAKIYVDHGVTPVSPSLFGPGIAFAISSIGSFFIIDFLIFDDILSLVAFVSVGFILYPLCILYFGGIQEEDVMLVNSIEERTGVDLEVLKRLARQVMA